MVDVLRPDDEAMGFLNGLQQSAQLRAVQAQNPEQHDPDEAAEALNLSKATGADPSLIYNDVPSFKQRLKESTALEFLRNNPRLQDYANSHVLAPVVSANDWPQLDTLDEKLSAFGRGMPSVVAAAAKGFKEHFDWDNALGQKEVADKYESNRLLWSIHSGITAPLYALGVGIPSETFTAGLAGLHEGLVEAQTQMGIPEGTARYNARQLASLVEARLMRLEGAPHLPIGAINEGLRKEIQRAMPYIEAGKEPPYSAGGLLEEAAKLQSKHDADAIKDLLKEAGKSETREKAPDLFRENFVRPYTEDARVGIDAEAVRQLYGNERPAADDGKLGWVPGIQEQFDRAMATGADVEVPIADLVSAELKPEVMQTIQDHIRVRAGGLTPEETKAPARVEEQPEKVTLYRAEGGEPTPGVVEPYAGVGTFYTDDPEMAKKYSEQYGGAPIHSIEIDADSSDILHRSGHEYVIRNEALPALKSGPSILDSVRKAAGLDLPLPVLGKGRPVLPPEGVIPPTSLIGQTITQRGIGALAEHSFTLKEGLAQIKTDHLDDFHKTLSDFFARSLSELVGDVKVHALSHVDFENLGRRYYGNKVKDFGGWYDPKTGDIIARSEELSGAAGHDSAVGMLLHEGAHALTHDALKNRPKIRDIFERMRKEFRTHLDDVGDIETFADVEYYLQNVDEFVAGGYNSKELREAFAATPISKELADLVGLKEPGHTMWDAFRQLINDILYWTIGTRADNSMLDAFLKMQERFEKDYKEPPTAMQELQSLLDSLPKGILKSGGGIPDYLQKAFKTGSALKMNNERLKAYLEKVAEQHEADIKFSKDQETLRAGKSATQDWKDNLPRVTDEARKDVWARPDIALDRYLRDGEFPNGSRETPIRLASSTIPDEYRSRIPEGYLRDRGVHPDILAARFGLQSGREVLEHLARLKEQRELEGLTPAAHVTQLVDQETQRRMEKDYGVTAEELLDAAKDHVFSPTTHDILHHELAALYEAQGQQPITQAAFKTFAKQLFDRIPIEMHSSDKYTAEMQRQRTAALDHLLEGNAVESLRAQEKAALLAYHADLSLKLEKQRSQFDRKVEKSWIRREPPGIDGQYAIWIHDILNKVGYQVKRIQGDWERQRDLTSNFKTLKEFVNHVSDTYSQDPDAMFPGQFPVAGFLTDEGFHKPIGELTPQEFTDVFNSLKAIDAFARNETKQLVGTQKLDRKEVLQGLMDRLKAAVGGKPVSEKRLPAYLRAAGGLLLNPETWMHRLDLGNALGPFNQLLIRPIMEGLYDERDMEKQFAALWKELPDIGKREKIENPNLFMDPRTNFETPIELDTHKLRAIIQNMGNELQRKKLASGYGIDDPNEIWDWLFNTIKIDRSHFKFAQQMGDIFEKAFEGTEQADVQRFGVAPQRIELGEIQTPWGMEREWYHPLIPDPLRHSGSLKAEDMLEESGFYRPSPSSGFREQRTGAVYPIDLGFDAVPFKLKQILKYNAMSNPVSEVSKIALDSRFRNAFKAYYGPEYEGALVKWLKDAAGNRNWIPSNERMASFALGQLQENLSSALIGFNLGTVLKHGPSALAMSMREVGPLNFLQSATQMLKELPGGQEAWTTAFEKSEELRSRWRSVAETIQGTSEELFKKFEKGHQFFKIRDAIKMAGHFPVAMSDLLSAVPMWDAAYRKAITEGMEEGDAVYSANTQVRRTHGSTIIGARAGITRMGDPFSRLLMPFYNFFSNALQRNYEMMWRARLAMQGRELPEMTGFEKESYEKGLSHLPKILGGVLVFGPLLGLIEQAVDPIEQKPDESGFKFWGKVLTRQYASMLPVVRDIINGLYTGHDPSAGMYGTIGRNVAEVLKSDTWLGDDPAKTWRRANAVIGAFTGLTNEEIGKEGQFFFNYMQGKEDAIRGPTDLYEVYRHGTLRHQPRTFPELLGQVGGARP